MFYKETVNVKVCASDSLSGVVAYYYYVDSTGGTVKTAEELDNISFTKYTGSVLGQNPFATVASLAPDGNYIVYAYAVDAAGNRSAYVCSEGVVVDSTAPAISNIVAPSKESSTLTDTAAQISFTSSEAGTYFYVCMEKDSSESVPNSIDDFATSDTNDKGMLNWTAKDKVSSSTMTADAGNVISLNGLKTNTEYTLYLAAVDQAGNSIQTIASKTFTTCKTMPTVAAADMPKISGTYGQTVENMTLTPGTAKVGSTVITGAWTVTDSGKTDTPSVGTTNTYQVTFTPDTSYNGRYDIVNVQVTPTVAQKVVTVTAENKTKTYGKNNPDLTFTVPEGALVGTDTEDDLGVTLSCEATVASSVKEGGYAITGTSSSANYNVTVTPGTLTIEKADATITVGTTSYDKTFGDAVFTLDVTDTNSEADVQCTVTTGNDVVSVSNGTVTILKAGTATITVSLPASTNYNAAEDKTITVTVSKNGNYSVEEINRSYLYSTDNAATIDLSKYLPANCGKVTYGTPLKNGDLYTDDGQPAVSDDGKLSYTVKQAETYGATGTIQVAVTTDNYADFTITVNVKLIDRIPVRLKEGSSVTLQNSTLIYGEALSKLAFYSAVFVDGDGIVVPGTLDWVDKTVKPTVAVTSATWKFTPDDSDYETLSGNLTIKVEKAEPNVKVLPTVAERTYHPTTKLLDTDLTDATVLDVNGVALTGTWSWKNANVVPTVENSGYEAVFTPDDTDNYKTISKTITVNVAKATPYIKTAPTAAAIIYGETLAKATLTGGSVQYSNTDDTAVAGTIAWKVDTTKPAFADSNTTAYTVVFTPTNKNYNTVEKDITVIVNKAENAPGMPESTKNVSYTVKTVGEAELPANWSWKEIDKATELTVGEAVTATAVYTGADAGNYEIESVEITITRQACTHENTELRNAKAATCTEKGYTGDTYCKDCGAKLASGTEIAMTDHKWDAGKVTKEATETEEGVMTYTCNVCGQTKTEAIPKKTASTTEPPKKGDVVADDKTSVKVEVTDVKKKEVAYKEPANKKAKTVTIPATVTIDGVTYKVTKIADNAFKGNKTVTKVTIGSNIKTIGKNSFSGATKLQTVTIGKNVTKIEANAFNGCKKLKTIKITSTKLTSKTVAKNAFKGLTKATTIKVPKKKLAAYKKLLKSKGLSSKVKVVGY